ncbi:hypothetical protein RF11_01624 [Thelohanellus kitauei]|uniref:UspA domain-containing protein n=1 Tax=Thelohanellus kitauei TaxID=669202 RepID=A0A0C2MSA0_THEKT|nr:hypothetical protein RF11_01624 [Thelohanellus kitauei]
MYRHPYTAKKVLFAVSEEPQCEKAFEYYAKNLHDKRDPVTLLNIVIPDISYTDGRLAPLGPDVLHLQYDQDEKYKKTEELLEGYLKKCQEMDLKCSKKALVLKTGKISDEIVSFAKEQADMIVMSGGRHSSFETLFLGSVTFNTIQKAMIPVLVIPKMEEEKSIK